MTPSDSFDVSAFVRLAEIGRVPADARGDKKALPIVVGVWRYQDHAPKVRIEREGVRANGETFTAKLGGLTATEASALGDLLTRHGRQIAQAIARAEDVSR